jgi:hypothetical protein
MNELTNIDALSTPAQCSELEKQAKSQGNHKLAHAARERRFQISIANLRTENECNTLIKNVSRNQRQDLLPAIHRKSIELSVNSHPNFSKLNNVEKDCLKVIYGYEKALTIKNGRRTRANYTWRPINEYGIIAGVDHIVSQAKETVGFNHLTEIGLTEYSFEAVVLSHPQSFSELARKRAQARIGI